MDKIKEASDVIIAINRYREGEIKDHDLIKRICKYFDLIKDQNFSQADLKFMRFISNLSGIPHYYDLLQKFGDIKKIKSFDLSTLSSIIYESTLDLDNGIKVHKYQKEILKQFEKGKLNRFFLSASTSFGKTRLVFEIIKKMQYKNVVLIFPTVALLSENLESITSKPTYSYFLDNYTIHTLSDPTEIALSNLFIYTPERFLSFVEKYGNKVNWDFVFVDEIYKIDNGYELDTEFVENERDLAFRLSIFEFMTPKVDILLAGPYIDFGTRESSKYNPSFDLFLDEYSIKLLNYNNYEIVDKNFTNVKSAKVYRIDDELTLDFTSVSAGKTEKLAAILKSILKIKQNCIVYCYSKSSAESYAKQAIESKDFSGHDFSKYSEFIDHLSEKFSKDWVITKALKNGIGIHHGLVPKYIQKEIISLFNEGKIHVLFSTTTITEGVNTSAKNLIVTQNKKGRKNLRKFDAKNIAGRAGRFLFHYSGRVIVLQNSFLDTLSAEGESIKHKNFDSGSNKDEIDIFYTKPEYLSQADKTAVLEIGELQTSRGIPNFILDSYKVVSKRDKIEIYDHILSLTDEEYATIKSLISKINISANIDYVGFQTVLNIVENIVSNDKLLFLISNKPDGKTSTLTHLTYFYLRDGFMGSVNFKLQQKKTIDKAISETADLVYNILKFQIVKYLGVFNLMYKYIESLKTKKDIDAIPGLEPLLSILEYNARTEKGKIASDYGVPSSIIKYFENNERSNLLSSFDMYELGIFNKVKKIIDRND